MEVLIFLVVVLTIITLIGHGIWVAIRAILRALFGVETKKDEQVTRLFDSASDPLSDLAAMERQLVRFSRDGKINDETYELLLARIRAERNSLLGIQTPKPTPTPAPAPPPAPAPAPIAPPPPSVVTAALVATDEEIIIKPVPTFIAPEEPAAPPPPPPPLPPIVHTAAN